MGTELTVQDMSIESMGDVFVKSGFFVDTKDRAQAIVKILAGRELGISPIASMTGVYIVKGKPSMGANLIAACVKNSGRYNYRIVTLTDAVCELEFFERFDTGQPLVSAGKSKFTIEDAKRAGTQNLDKFPRNMLFARAMSNGAKWYAASIFSGGVYTPDELGATVQYDDAGEIKNVVDAEFKPEQPPVTNPEPVTSDAPCEMTLEEAENTKSKEGTRYGDMKTDDLTGHTIGLAKSLNGGKLNSKEQDLALQHLKAANMVINSRKQSETGKG